FSEIVVPGDNNASSIAFSLPELRPKTLFSPCPDVAKPYGGQNMQPCGFRATVPGRNTDQNVFRSCLAILDKNIEVTVLVKHAGIHQLVFPLVRASAAVDRNQLVI